MEVYNIFFRFYSFLFHIRDMAMELLEMRSTFQDRIYCHARSGQSIELERVHYEWSRVFANVET